MSDDGLLSLLPPLLAIGLAVGTRQVYLSLAVGVWLGWTILAGGPLAGLVGAVDAAVAVFADGERTRILLVTVLIGSLLTLAQRSGGMAGFVEALARRGLVRTRRAAGLLAWGLGLAVFVESVIGVLVAGTVTRPLFDRLRVSREKLAYLLDSTCAPKAIVFPLNTWGAYVIGLLVAQGVERPLATLLAAIPLNFYALAAILLALGVVLAGRDVGPMREAERRTREEGKLLRDGAEPLVATEALVVAPKAGAPRRAANLLVPVGAVVATLPAVLLATGKGNVMEGSGTLAAFWGVLVGVAVAAVAYRLQGILSLDESVETAMRGIGGLVPVGVLLVLAFAIGDVCGLLGTGRFVAGIAEAGLPRELVPAALFLVAAAVSFSTGTSFGTWAILIPIAVPLGRGAGVPTELAVAAVLGGGIFGDHCSPISDSTIVASMAAATDHIDHVRTQLPYALLAAAASLALYVVAGFVW